MDSGEGNKQLGQLDIHADIANKDPGRFDKNSLYSQEQPKNKKIIKNPPVNDVAILVEADETDRPQIKPEFDPKLHPHTPLSDERKRDMKDDLKILVENQKLHNEYQRRLKLKRIMRTIPGSEDSSREEAV